MNRIETIASYSGMAVVVALALLTGLDVVGRYVFNSPLMGTFELTEVIMALLIACGIVVTTAKDEHIAVDAIFEKLPASAQRKLVVFGNILGVLVFGILSWKGADAGIDSIRDRETTELLNVPVFPFRVFLFIGFLACFVFLMNRIVHSLIGKHG